MLISIILVTIGSVIAPFGEKAKHAFLRWHPSFGRGWFGQNVRCERQMIGWQSLVLIAICGAASSAWGATAPRLPATAKKLSAAEIAVLYDGTSRTFTRYEGSKIARGLIEPNFRAGTIGGQWVEKNGSRSIAGTIRMVGDKYCVTITVEECVTVYLNGVDIFEVDEAGNVATKMTR